MPLRLGPQITQLPVLQDLDRLLDTDLSWQTARTPTPEREARAEARRLAQERRAGAEREARRQADRLFRGATRVDGAERDPRTVVQTFFDPVAPRPSKERRREGAPGKVEERVYVQRRMPPVPMPPAEVKRKKREKSPNLDAMLERIGSDYGLRRLRVAEQSTRGLKDRKAILREDVLIMRAEPEHHTILREEPGGRVLEFQNIPVDNILEFDPLALSNPLSAAKDAREARRQAEERRKNALKTRQIRQAEQNVATSSSRSSKDRPTRSRTKVLERDESNTTMERAPVHAWATVLPSVGPPVPGGPKIPIPRKDACDSLRIMLFGRIGSEKFVDKEKIYYENIGTKEQVLKLWSLWVAVDEEETGEIDFVEFCKYVPKAGHIPKGDIFRKGDKDRQGLGDKIMKFLSSWKRPVVTLSDCFRILWPGARDEHMKEMKSWLQDHERMRHRVPTPPLLSNDQQEGLSENFRAYDRDASGTVSINELIYAGLITEEMECVFREFDQDNNGMLDAEEFLQMLCPCGYRAEESSRSCFDEEGKRLILDDSDPECIFWKRFELEKAQRDVDGWIHPALRSNESDRRDCRPPTGTPSFLLSPRESDAQASY